MRFGGHSLSVRFVRDFLDFRRMASAGKRRFPVLWRDRYPCLDDNTPTTGFDRHYVYHPAWAARILARTMPPYHVDISSTLHFCSIVSAFVPVRFYDYRPVRLDLENLETGVADLLSLPFEDKSLPSLSCMHVVEHVGLGRYGDPLDPDGDLKSAAELKRVLGDGGSLIFVVPVGKPRIHFNAHRVYSYGQVVDCFAGLDLREFALVPDDPKEGGIILNAPRDVADSQMYGCGCFWFQRPGP